MKTGRRGRGRGARRGPRGPGGRRRERGESTAAPVVPTERVEEPAQSYCGRSAPACSDQVLASKEQKANMALTRKRVADMPLDVQKRHKRRKAAKDLHVESPSPLHEASPVTGDIGSDTDEEDPETCEVDTENEFELRKSYRICNFFI